MIPRLENPKVHTDSESSLASLAPHGTHPGAEHGCDVARACAFFGDIKSADGVKSLVTLESAHGPDGISRRHARQLSDEIVPTGPVLASRRVDRREAISVGHGQRRAHEREAFLVFVQLLSASTHDLTCAHIHG